MTKKSNVSDMVGSPDVYQDFQPDFFSPEARDKRSQDSGLDASYETSLRDNSSQSVHQAQQSAGDEHSIVNLVDKLVRHGVGVDMPVPISSELVSATDYHTAMNQIRQAETDFLQLPADVRAHFNNDAGAFLQFFHDEKNSDEARKLGFLVSKTPNAPVKVELSDEDRKSFFGFKKPKEEGVGE